ncbi:MAG: thiamine pyrophosphate-dependent dehydrogenase E1 component subunit alpha [Deltaproteobacteria bacterium]|nr:thiamine pyrophosphate-dependent dehydrogenase E1 component subunit alpha [Deltaproteobacteria bacterium]
MPFSKEKQIKIHDLMVKARLLEERLIKMNKSGLGFFWIGGAGEEAFHVPLGMLIKKGEGLDYDFLHFHYRQSATLLTLGVEMIDVIRQMHNTAADPYSGGRNFVNHFAVKKWNVVNVTSPIEVQLATCIGTGVAHRRHGGEGITIVTGGDAGTAEGEFASALGWASRKDRELPILNIVTDNRYGISTPFAEVHCDRPIAERGRAFGIESATINGNDVAESYAAIEKAMAYVRKKRKPYLLEVKVSRLYGHSSASGANWVEGEVDGIVEFEKKLKNAKILGEDDFKKVREKYEQESIEAVKKVLKEPKPKPEVIFEHIFADRKDAEIPWPPWLKK